MNLESIPKHSHKLKQQLLTDGEKWRKHLKRVNFGEQPLKLGMFIPCDEDGNVLERPELYLDKVKYVVDDTLNYKYQQALSNVIFKGFEVSWINPTGEIIDVSTENSKAEVRFYIPKNKPLYAQTIEDLTDLGIELIKDKI